MESQYGIAVKNKFALFFDEETDPLDLLRQQEEEKERRKVEKAVPTKDKKPVKTTKLSTKDAKKSKDTPSNKAQEPLSVRKDENQARGPRRFNDSNAVSGSNRGGDRQYFEDRKNRRNNPEGGENARPARRNYEGDGGESNQRWRGDGAGEFRGGRGGGGGGRGRGNRPPRREFDRHSGDVRSGVKAVDKRGGEGPNNWGSAQSDIRAEQDEWGSGAAADQSANEAGFGTIPEGTTNDDSKEEGGVVADEAKVEEDAVPVPEEPVTMSLDEYKRQREEKRSRTEFNVRKVVTEKAEWKNMYVLKKKRGDGSDDEEEEGSDEEDEDESEEEDEEQKRRLLQNIRIQFSDGPMRRGGRGGPGSGGRGGRGGREGGGREGGGPPRGGDDRFGPRTTGGSGGEAGGAVAAGRDNNESGGGGGMRRGGGGGRGGGGRGGSRGGRGGRQPQQQSAPRVDDWNDFPSLVAA